MSQVVIPNRQEAPEQIVASTAVRSLVWKQLRDYRMLLAWVLGILISGPWLLFSLADTSAGFWDLMHPLVSALSCATAVAIAVLSFVDERESGTKELLGQFPVAGRQVAALKMGCSLVAVLLYLSVAMAVVICMALVMIRTSAAAGVQTVGYSLVEWLELSRHELVFTNAVTIFVFGIASLGSIRSNSSLVALMMIAFGGVVGFLLLSALANWVSLSHKTLLWLEPLDSLLLIHGVVLIGLAFLVAPSWLSRPVSRERRSKAGGWWGSLSGRLAPRESQRSGVVSALLWQSFRQQRMILLFLSATMLALFLFVFFNLEVYAGRYAKPSSDPAFLLLLTLGGFAFAGFAAAIGCIYHDKFRQRFHFFRQHREYGGWFWFSRVLFPLGFLLASSMLFAFVASVDNWAVVAGFVGLSAFALTLAINFLLSSLVYAGAVGMLGSAACFALGVGLSAMDIGAVDLAMLIPVGWLGLSFVYSTYWISGIRSVGEKFALVVLIGIVFLVAVLGVRQYRLASANNLIANWNRLFDGIALQFEPVRPNLVGREVGRDVQSLFGELCDFQSGRGSLEECDFSQFQSADELVSAMVQDPVTLGFYSSQLDSEWGHWKSRRLLELAAAKGLKVDPWEQFLVLRAIAWQDQFVNQGRRDLKSREVLAWITDAARTESELARAIVELQNYSVGRVLNLVEAKKKSWKDLSDYEQKSLVSPPLQWVPWERERAIQLADHFRIPPSYLIWFDAASKPDAELSVLFGGRQFEFMTDYFAATRPAVAIKSRVFEWLASGLNADVNATVQLIQNDRYLMLRAALEIFRLKHGRYPDDLERLCPEILEVLPVSVTGDRFYYGRPERESWILVGPTKDEHGYFEWVLTEQPLLVPYLRTKSELFVGLDELEAELDKRFGDRDARNSGANCSKGCRK